MTEAPFAFLQCDADGCEKTTGLKKCSNCKCYAFCSRECQATFWKAGGHKHVCADLKSLRENGHSVVEIRSKLDAKQSPYCKPQSCLNCNTGCNCQMKEGDPCALYRQLDGEKFFTGMVSPFGSGKVDFSKCRKLHDAGDDIITGEYHTMSGDEIMTEFAHYDDASKETKDIITPVGLVKLGSHQDCPFLPKLPLSSKDMILYEKCDMSGLVDFSHKPPEFVHELWENKFDIKYPFPDGLKPKAGRIKIQNARGSGLPRWAKFDVRARDDVCVMVAGTFLPGNRFGQPAGMGFTERMWVDVTSITSFGMIAGIPRVPVEDAMSYLANKDKCPFISFPITCVVGVRHYKKEDGGYW